MANPHQPEKDYIDLAIEENDQLCEVDCPNCDFPAALMYPNIRKIYCPNCTHVENR